MAARTPLIPVDGVEVLTVVDNVTDLLLPSTPIAKRLGAIGAGAQRMQSVEAPLVESGRAPDAPLAEHGLALYVGHRGRGWELIERGVSQRPDMESNACIHS